MAKSWRQDQLRKIDLDAYLRSRVQIKNEDGGRGYDHGVRIFDCVWCDDEAGRGWVNIEYGAAGCFNGGCPAEGTVDGGALEWARGVEGFNTIGHTIAWLQQEFPFRGERPLPTPIVKYTDFCRLPPESMLFGLDAPILQVPYADFAKRKWGLSHVDLKEAFARWCSSGSYAGRIIFPVLMGGKPVAFQARTIYGDGRVKYLTSKFGEPDDPEAECGRPQQALLYGVDDVPKGGEVALVEGITDVLASRKGRSGVDVAPELTFVGILGMRLSTEKLAILARLRPKRVIVALDSHPETDRASQRAVDDLRAWGIPVARGVWQGGKDAGSGAALRINDLGLKDRVSGRLST